ncbi:MAG: 3-deoxy-manno-octulosonate cytidylyltransferase [Candidatus Neomarinimicrobiota bacterium]
MNIGIIPARLNSKRFPKKILTPLNGKPMVVNTVERSLMAKNLDRVILAIDSEETKKALIDFDFDIVMTSKDHTSGTDRIAEVVQDIEEANIIINIQGDEPMIDPKIIDSLINKLEIPSVEFATIISKNLSASDILNPNIVKAFINEREEIVEFKRNIFDFQIGGAYRHIGLYGYTRDTLMKFTNLPPSEDELSEKLEQLRAINNGIKIHALIEDYDSISIDTKQDLEILVGLLNSESER